VFVAKLTGWGLGDLLDLTVDELLKWHSAATVVNEEIAAMIKKEGQGR
jgi:hypothetical protein